MNLEARLICEECVGETHLKSTIRRVGQEGTCAYCGHKSICLSLEKLADLVQTAFEDHYHQVDEDPENDEGQPIVEAIAESAMIDEDGPASDIQKILEDRFFDRRAYKEWTVTAFSSESHYEKRGIDDADWQERWHEFENSLKSENRFFSYSAGRLLADVFNGIEEFPTFDRRAVVLQVGPGAEITSVYRARCFQSDNRLKEALIRPDRELGPPPSETALPGRMNAHGISVFYGSSDPDAALGEVRPPVGSQVAVARFEIIRPLRILDLTALRNVDPQGSIFDPKFAPQLERAAFLHTLCDRIMIPVMPDHERFEYLATQAIADFLASRVEFRLDGIAFPAIQSPGKHMNYVFFHKAARVEPLEPPKGVSVDARLGYYDEEGWFSDYQVLEKRNPIEDAAIRVEQPLTPFGTLPLDFTPEDYDFRELSLRIDQQSIFVHQVKGISFDAPAFKVSRICL